jgi:hypothetical protein
MLLAERLLLLDRQLDGSPWVKARTPAQQNRLAACACLIELAIGQRLQDVAGQLQVVSDVPAHYMVLSDTLAILQRKPSATKDAPDLISRATPRMASELLASMSRRGLLIEESTRKYGFIKHTRYSVQSTSAYQACVNLLLESATQFGLSDLPSLGILLLADRADITRHLLPKSGPIAPENFEAKLSRFESLVSGQRAALDPTARSARLIFTFTHALGA